MTGSTDGGSPVAPAPNPGVPFTGEALARRIRLTRVAAFIWGAAGFVLLVIAPVGTFFGLIIIVVTAFYFWAPVRTSAFARKHLLRGAVARPAGVRPVVVPRERVTPGVVVSPAVAVAGVRFEQLQFEDDELDVVGESHYLAALSKLWKRFGDDTVILAVLVPEPTNPYDSDAVAVFLGSGPADLLQVGHLPSELAVDIAAALAGHAARGTRAVVGGSVHAFESREGRQLFTVNIGGDAPLPSA